MNLKFTGLWLQTDFKKLWAGQASSLFGTQSVFLILPLAAVIVLNATPLQMGIVTAMGGLPAIFGIFLGAWVDRRKRLPIIVAADVGRGSLLLAVPAAHLLGLLTIELIYAVAFGIGLMTILFQISYRPFLAAIVEQHELIDANSKLEMAGSATSAIGPGIGGVLVQVVTAPFAMLFGAVAYFTSAVLFRWIRVTEDLQQLSRKDESGIGALREGFRFFRHNRTLLGIATSQLMLGTFSAMLEVVLLLYLVRELGLSAGIVGALVAAGSIGSFVGAGMATRLTAAIGLGRAMTGGILLIGISAFSIPLAGGTQLVIIATLIVIKILIDAGGVIYTIGTVSLRLAVTPDRLGGRITSIMVVLSRVGLPIGALLGGVLGELTGLRSTLLVGAVGMAASSLWLVYFRVWSIRSIDDVAAS